MSVPFFAVEFAARGNFADTGVNHLAYKGDGFGVFRRVDVWLAVFGHVLHALFQKQELGKEQIAEFHCAHGLAGLFKDRQSCVVVVIPGFNGPGVNPCRIHDIHVVIAYAGAQMEINPVLIALGIPVHVNAGHDNVIFVGLYHVIDGQKVIIL